MGAGGVAMRLLIFALVIPLWSQVSIRFTPEPMVVPTSVVSNARSMGWWEVEGCNDGAASANVAYERISMASGTIRWIAYDDAVRVLNTQQSKGFWPQFLRYASLAGQGVAIGVSAAGVIKNAAATTAIGVGSAMLPSIISLARTQQPAAVTLPAPLKYPIILPPGACFSDYRFAAKMKSPQVVTGVIK